MNKETADAYQRQGYVRGKRGNGGRKNPPPALRRFLFFQQQQVLLSTSLSGSPLLIDMNTWISDVRPCIGVISAKIHHHIVILVQ